jgi:hypothetical protein
MFGSISDLDIGLGTDARDENIVLYPIIVQKCIKVYSTNINKNLLLVLLGDPDCVQSQITRVVCQIVRFDFDRNLVL